MQNILSPRIFAIDSNRHAPQKIPTSAQSGLIKASDLSNASSVRQLQKFLLAAEDLLQDAKK
jgi:hypothetical protein